MRTLIDRPEDRAALWAWLLTRLGVLVAAVVAAARWSFGDLSESFLDRWTQWDTDHLIEIAKYGYDGDPAETPDAGLPGFFPGYPLLLRTVHVVVPDWRLAALLISLTAGAVAMCALSRLAEFEFAAWAGDRRIAGSQNYGLFVVIAILVSPEAVFLFAGYSEALFLGFALPAWLCARQGRWELAVACATAAAAVRITGVFLAVAIIVEFLTGSHRPRCWATWRWSPLLLLPFASPIAYAFYQWRRTGDWFAWQHAQEEGWGRDLVAPWDALATTWNAAFGVHNEFTEAFRVELAAAAIGVALLAGLLVRHRWAESTYIGLQLAALLCSSYYLSIGRATLLWWPLWLAVGLLGVHRPRLYAAYLVLAAPLLVMQILTFTSGEWAG